jgi:hypothetical protein
MSEIWSRREAIRAAADEVSSPGLRERLLELVEIMPGRTHGIRATYVNGCHCTACRAANAAYMRSRRRR